MNQFRHSSDWTVPERGQFVVPPGYTTNPQTLLGGNFSTETHICEIEQESIETKVRHAVRFIEEYRFSGKRFYYDNSNEMQLNVCDFLTTEIGRRMQQRTIPDHNNFHQIVQVVEQNIVGAVNWSRRSIYGDIFHYYETNNMEYSYELQVHLNPNDIHKIFVYLKHD